MSKVVRKAVVPAAGLGTRFLPATKATPKEMLPVVDKPTIQYVVEEAVAAGLEDVLFITGRSKRPLEDHFDRNFELEFYLEQKGSHELLKEVQATSELGDIHYIYSNRLNLGKLRADENALWSLGVHDLSVILWLIQDEIVEASAHGHAFLTEGDVFTEAVAAYMDVIRGEALEWATTRGSRSSGRTRPGMAPTRSSRSTWSTPRSGSRLTWQRAPATTSSA